jgi:hypothetical protein
MLQYFYGSKLSTLQRSRDQAKLQGLKQYFSFTAADDCLSAVFDSCFAVLPYSDHPGWLITLLKKSEIGAI